jgi:ATP-dependent Clp protease ATP-binding subunit ClpX
VKKFNPDEPLRCSFCHKTQEQVEKLISSPSDYPRAYICNECVSVCQTILEDEKREQATAPARRLPRPPESNFSMDMSSDRIAPRKSSPSRFTTTTNEFS